MTVEIASLVSDNLDIWTTAVERKTGAGRGGGKRVSLYGIDRLRALILELAVRGKLVPQDVGDEPASVLLKKISSERAKWTKTGSIGKRRASENSLGDAPYPVPEGWAWTKLADIGHDWGQTEPSGDFTYVDVSSIDPRAGAIRSPSVLTASEAPSRARKIVRVGTVIYSTVRPYLLNIAIVDQEFEPEPIASTAFAIVHPFEGVAAGFLYRYLRSATFISYVEDCQTGIAYPAINDKQFFSAWFPLPPLAEQQRIVAKVDELMALCDALEAESAAAMAAHHALVEALLATLTASSDAADLSTNWARLEAHFDTLFTTEASIDALKQSLLDIAVHGKLVAQDKNDEGASTLLRRIQNERANIIGAKKASKIPTKIDGAVTLPDGWEWTPLACLGVTMTGGTPKSAEPENFAGSIPFIGPGQISPAGEVLAAERFISETGLAQSTVALPGDILMVCIGGSIGKSAISRARMAYNQQINSLRPVLAEGRYIDMYLRCSRFQAEVLDRATGSATPIINRSRWETIPVALPPLLEQQRIVAKVDELLAICDQILSDLADAALIQKHIAETIVELAAA